MANYSHDKIVPFRDSQLGKKQQVAEMFDQIAFRYDFLNRFLSGGIDVYWRKRAIRELRRLTASAAAPVQALDVATGTGDMAIMMCRYLPGSRVTGVDISTGMLEVGRQKLIRTGLASRVILQPGDSEALPFPDGGFDAVTVAFGVRNFENLEKGLQEMRRVLKPGGKLVVLEFSQPRTPGIRQLYLFYLRLVAPGIAKMASSNGDAYRYLNHSVQAFPEGKAFMRILEGCGYTHTRLRRLSLGICSLYVGEKPAAEVSGRTGETTGDRN
ncbi:MAG TPA: bifunctional demethylmenaquinone methyltransferase/2-methoxy-6-polyprenyl-1,4-benzoquinol methylase UbiE [Puia sp.]|nr:bifunctional demethylmenaquinone methyltransferase/2-methoxy-6-polyprenyl-1,4-benzoquinol methylase UbiE [Puia sp.]